MEAQGTSGRMISEKVNYLRLFSGEFFLSLWNGDSIDAFSLERQRMRNDEELLKLIFHSSVLLNAAAISGHTGTKA